MKKYLYPVLVFTFVALVAVIVIFRKETPISNLKERKGAIALSSEWLNTKEAIEGLLATIRSNPNNLKAKLNLAQAYMQEARVTGDHQYYDNAALQLLASVLEKEPENFEALCCKSSILLSQHHFSEGLIVAEKAVAINPNSAFVYGLLCDAHVELGHYNEAVKMTDKMVSIRPDLKSYARVSYLREIHGDVPGAIVAMKMAVSAGYPGLEQTAWTRITLGHIYENNGDLVNAEIQYRMALEERPGYPFAYAGLGNIAKARKNFPEAITLYEKAKVIIPDPSFDEKLTDLYRLNKEPGKADKSAANVIAMLSPKAEGEEGAHGHYDDKELAYVYLKMFKYNLALKHATIEYDRRPDNIEACETLAWVNYKCRNYKKAGELILDAMRTHSQNPVLLYRAGLIKIKNGDEKNGIALVNKAVNINPFIDRDLTYKGAPYLAVK